MIGLTPDSPFALRNKLKVFNIAILAVFIISCFYFVVALSREYYLATIVTSYSTASSLLVFYLVHKTRYSFAYHYAMWYALVFLSAFTFIFGAITNSYYYFLFLPIACNVLFDDKRTINCYFIVSVVAMLVNVVLLDYVKPYYNVDDSERWLGYPNIPFVMLLTFLSVRMFKNENRKYALRIEEQRAAMEEKNVEITDSINYAQRIQSTLLAPEALMKKNLPEHFIFYKPKDIVSGDFYWAAESVLTSSQDPDRASRIRIGSGSVGSAQSGSGNKFWLCVGDCTGHGVPGAFMSLLNISILKELITEQKISSPDQVLNKQREAIIAALNPDGAIESGKDGMDCALLCFDKETNRLSFALANSHLLIVRGGTLIEFRPDKQPVGLHEGVSTSFTLQEVQLQKGDVIYSFTDGFADQFGGPRGKKFKYSQLKETLVRMAVESSDVQRQKLAVLFESWRGNLEQVDDVLVIGIRV